MNKILLGTSLAAAFALTSFVTAQAALVSVPLNFITVTDGQKLTFTFTGKNAADTDQLEIQLGVNTFIFDNNTPIGTTFTTGPLGAGQYLLSLVDLSVPATWSSYTTANSDGQAHIKQTTNFADFNLGAAPIASPLYYGWEDRAFPAADADFNDLTFTIHTVPEPAALGFFGIGLAALGLFYRRREVSRKRDVTA